MIESLQSLLQIPSVKGPPKVGNPFGAEVTAALEYVLGLAEQHGLPTKNIGGYAGHVEFGVGEEYIAVLSHLDVVPEGTGWTYPPYGAEVHDGKVYARGAIDDKGPALSTLWALIALKELGYSPKRKIRLIFGLDEESSWQCMEHYFANQPLPLGGFTPDADFPLIHAEKGVGTLRISVKADEDSMNPRVTEFSGGQRDNMVPDFATVTVDCHSETAAQQWEEKILREAHVRQADADVIVEDSKIRIEVCGVSAHGSTPDKGINAITSLASLLIGQPVSNSSMWRFIAAQDTAGSGLGIDGVDEVTGPLTTNLGTAQLIDGEYQFDFNIRYPIDQALNVLVERCRDHVSDKWTVKVVHDLPPLYVPLGSPVIQVLSGVYERIVGEPATPLTMGGATYARAIPNAVAFGPMFPGQADCAHQPDENWELENYFRCVQIYAHAMFELANTL